MELSSVDFTLTEEAVKWSKMYSGHIMIKLIGQRLALEEE